MAALIGAEVEIAAADRGRRRRRAPCCDVANDNGAGQVVLSGEQAPRWSAPWGWRRPAASSAR